ncbi:hypothetical protein [Desulfonema magnum]|uniref:P-loop containing n=1 Tax=Desulfonema magnum TaxID=45655 RepID=A0A975BHC1_9BACT|nr:hypothetical protein [Desulfonema magnum]QTA85224.1 p-loop containing [Desulfonema magnum]
MREKNVKMRYPLSESIGDPDLLVGREKEFALLGRWLDLIPRRMGKSRVLLGRRKSGKTAIVQRIFNRLWTENRGIIPFYFNIKEKKTWYPDFAIGYYRAFASQYISFLEQDERLVRSPLSLERIREYGMSESLDILAEDVSELLWNRERELYDSVWEIAYTAPRRFADIFDQRILVIIDEFQNITQYIYPDRERRTEPDETLAGSFHEVVESKIAPMLVTGSYVGWLISVIDKYLEAGRLRRTLIDPYLTSEHGLQAVYKYAEASGVPVTNESAEQINQLCMSDPFFISCVIQSEFEGKDLTTEEGVVNTVHHEITDRESEMSMTWGEYIELMLDKVNDRHAKQMLLHLSRYPDRDWTPRELKKELGLDIDEGEIRKKLEIMVRADVIRKGAADIDFRGLSDGTLNLILRRRFEKEIRDFAPDLKKDFNEELDRLRRDRNSLRGRLGNLVGKFAEFQLFTEFRSRKRFSLSAYFDGAEDDTKLNITDVRMREKFQRRDGKETEIDVLADSDCGRTILVEVKKTKDRTGLRMVRTFQEKREAYSERFPKRTVLPAFLSVGGFTRGAMKFCKENGIGTATEIRYFQEK